MVGFIIDLLLSFFVLHRGIQFDRRFPLTWDVMCGAPHTAKRTDLGRGAAPAQRNAWTILALVVGAFAWDRHDYGLFDFSVSEIYHLSTLIFGNSRWLLT